VARKRIAAVNQKLIKGAKMSQEIYTDGGVILRNPSTIGGTWAWCLVENDEIINSGSGVIDIETARTWELDGVTNNLTELYALCKAITSLPDNWEGVVYSDSLISLGRLFMGYKWKGIPDELREWAQLCASRIPQAGYMLLDGHPTKAHLEAGIGKRGYPVSKFNVWCDKQCGEEAKQYLAKLEL
jgi:ribonuclease HI